MIRTLLAGLLLWAASKLIPKPCTPRVEPLAKFTEDAQAWALFMRERELQRLMLADQVIAKALGWKPNEVSR